MKPRSVRRTAAFMCALSLVAEAASADGIPEPGLVLYGSVTNRATRHSISTAAVEWTVTGGGSSAALTSTIANVNGQTFYVVRIPFETRVVGSLAFAPTPNTLPLPPRPGTFTRSVTVEGVGALLVPPASASFAFGRADRGRMERVDLIVDLPGDPARDRDGDGLSDWAEGVAGTDPDDANSVLKLVTDLRPAAGGGLLIQWSSVSGKSYALSRAAALDDGFMVVADLVVATGEVTSFTDTGAQGAGPFFYRLQVQP